VADSASVEHPAEFKHPSDSVESVAQLKPIFFSSYQVSRSYSTVILSPFFFL
jgi:hypothetical protein